MLANVLCFKVDHIAIIVIFTGHPAHKTVSISIKCSIGTDNKISCETLTARMVNRLKLETAKMTAVKGGLLGVVQGLTTRKG